MSTSDYIALPCCPRLSTPQDIRAWKPQVSCIDRANGFKSDATKRVARLTSGGLLLKLKLLAAAVMAAMHPLLQARIICTFIWWGYYKLAIISFSCTIYPIITMKVITSSTSERQEAYQQVFGSPPTLCNVVGNDLLLLVLNVPNALQAGSYLPHGKQCYLKLRGMCSILAENLPWSITQCVVWHMQESYDRKIVPDSTLALSLMSALFNVYSSYDYLKTYSKYTHEGVWASFLKEHLRLGMGMAPPDLLIKLRTFRSVTCDVDLAGLTSRAVLSIGYIIGASVTLEEVTFKDSSINKLREKSQQTFVNFMDETCANRHLLAHIKFEPRVEMPAEDIGRGAYGLRLQDIKNGDDIVYMFQKPCNDHLFFAIESGDVSAVRARCPADDVDKAMIWCAQVGHWKALAELLACGLPLPSDLSEVIQSACKEDQQLCLQLLLDYGVKPDGMLEHAALEGKTCAVKVLLASRADASEASLVCGGTSNALSCAMFYDRPEMVKALVDGRANPTTWSDDGSQPLHTYAQYGNCNSIKVLLAARVDVNARAKRSGKINRAKTPLMIAAYRGQVETVKVLLEFGAYTDLKDLEGLTALDAAMMQGGDDVENILRATTRTSPPSSAPLVGPPEVRFLLSPEYPAREEVTGTDHIVVDHTGETATLEVTEGAVEFTGSSRVALNAPLNVGNKWGIMAWFRTPMPGWGQQGFQNLCANHGMNGGPVVLDAGRLGVWISQQSPSEQRGGGTSYCVPECNMIQRFSNDAPGWHHLVAIGVNGQTIFYVDGEQVGTAEKCNTDPLNVIGHMCLGLDLQESWGGAMKDFMVFQDALSPAEVSSIFQAGVAGALA